MDRLAAVLLQDVYEEVWGATGRLVQTNLTFIGLEATFQKVLSVLQVAVPPPMWDLGRGKEETIRSVVTWHLLLLTEAWPTGTLQDHHLFDLRTGLSNLTVPRWQGLEHPILKHCLFLGWCRLPAGWSQKVPGNIYILCSCECNDTVSICTFMVYDGALPWIVELKQMCVSVAVSVFR